MEILFVGNERRGNFALAPCERRGDNLTYSGDSSHYSHVKNIVNLILQKNDPEYQALIVDIELFIDDSEEIAETLKRIQKVNNAKIIIYASGYHRNSEMIISLLKRDFKNFILAITPAEIVDQLEKGLNNYYEVNGMDELHLVKEKIDIEEEHDSQLVYKSIGIAGALPRIGATTQAIQIVKYLTLMGYKACYIELNNHGFLKAVKDLYGDWKEDTDLRKVTFQNVDLFSKDNINEVLRLGYDFYVKDYGVYASGGFENLSFLEQDINIIIAGAKPEEVESVIPISKSTYYQDAFYIFSFIPKADHEDILDMMVDHAPLTHFAEYAPDPFVYSTECNHIYKDIIKVKSIETSKKGLFSIFSRKEKEKKKKKKKKGDVPENAETVEI